MPDLRNIAIWLLLALAVAGWGTGCVERTRAAGARADLAAEKRSRTEESTARALAALADLQRTVTLMATHAEIQKENADAYEARLAVLASRGRTVAAELGRVREQYRTFAALDREQALSDPAACQRVADRSAVLAAMAAQSRELLERGRLIVEGRDNEVQLLLDTVKNDRALIAQP
ncbi:hypothetical protein [Variovorax sp. EBFNA2]|uniref:hypothetical protein n=1 Tax=Variovorax sp. EBFNA2 TaxID=3342097 RepID=UPI0029C0615D|nr:hypothetical protein [Variovorax boronicumulans]WPG35288.1 hypothetical protein RZE79_17530 [Variovorax boronicumulans]